MKIFLAIFYLSGNVYACGRNLFPRRKLLYIFSAIIFLFAFGFADAQNTFLPNRLPSNFNSANSYQQKNISNLHNSSFDEGDNSDASPYHFATITAAATGNWNNAATWVGGVIPGAGDDVVISSGMSINVDASSSAHNVTINNNGTLTFSAGANLSVAGSWINNGTLTAGTGSVTFGGGVATYNSISGNSPSAFNDITINEGTNPTFILEANGTGAISNTGILTILNGLFEMTTGTFQFGGNAGVTIPASGGIWIRNTAIFNSGN